MAVEVGNYGRRKVSAGSGLAGSRSEAIALNAMSACEAPFTSGA
jgi:hypothetical protein